MLSLNMDIDDICSILKKYGYCLSESIAADMIVKWFIKHWNGKNGNILFAVNELLEEMGLPLLMTRIK